MLPRSSSLLQQRPNWNNRASRDPSLHRSASSTTTTLPLSTKEKVLNYISGNSTDLTDIPASLLDQSQILKHLLSAANTNTTCRLDDNLNIAKNQVLDSSIPDFKNSNILKSSLSVTIGDESLMGANTLSASKLTSKSSSSGSVYSGQLDNTTPTSGYSSGSACTQFVLPRPNDSKFGSKLIFSNNAHENYTIRDLPPPPAYPHWRNAKDEVSATISGSVATNQRASVSLSRDTDRGRSSVGGGETRRDLSLGPQPSSRLNAVNVHLDDNSEHTNMSSLSRSQPDLSKLNAKENQSSHKNPLLSEKLASHELPGVVDLLYNENHSLQLQLEICARKISKLQKFETEIVKVQGAHESLVQICSRREQLEKLTRTKLQNQIQSLNKQNSELKDELDRNASSDPARRTLDESLRRDINKRDVIIAQLVAQNKEVSAAKERLEMEVAAQKQTLAEQRTHIEVLDSALSNAQSNIHKLEEEVGVYSLMLFKFQLLNFQFVF